MSYRLVEHTADMGLEVQAASLEELFGEAADGLRELMFGPPAGDSRLSAHLQVSGQEVGELLVNWLNDILYLFEVRGIYPVAFEVQAVSDTSATGLVRGEPFDAGRHPVERVVKAVTYHQLEVRRTAADWRARVYVDL